jgi:hypothetical protein
MAGFIVDATGDLNMAFYISTGRQLQETSTWLPTEWIYIQPRHCFKKKPVIVRAFLYLAFWHEAFDDLQPSWQHSYHCRKAVAKSAVVRFLITTFCSLLGGLLGEGEASRFPLQPL